MAADLPILYGYFRSSAAYRVRIALNLKGIEAKSAFVHLRDGEQRGEAYRALNPSALVPFWQEEGFGLGQSLAIIEYLDETHPAVPLLPKTPRERALVREVALAIACDIHPVGNLRVLQQLEASFGADNKAKAAWAAHFIEIGLEPVEARLRQTAGRFCFGDTPGLADVCLVPQLANARRFRADIARFETILRVQEACAALPAFQNAAPENQPDAE